MKLSDDDKALVERFSKGVGRSFANGWHGPEAVLNGLRALKMEVTTECRFIVANRNHEDHVYEVTVRFDRGTAANDWNASFRQSEGGTESGLGSGKDTALAAVALVAKLSNIAGAKSAHIVGQPNLEIFRDTREVV